jgi:glycerophosphoryl diester phosphodiesterase
MKRLLFALSLAWLLSNIAEAYDTLNGQKPIVIGHRGASGYRPEHTLAAYELAILQGADFIEPDLVLTKDGVPIARHEPLFGATAVNGVAVAVPNEFTTTNIFDHPEFAGRLRTRNLDGNDVTGFWADDFTLAEVKTLLARERIPGTRPGNVPFNDLYQIPTLQEVIDLAQAQTIATGRTIGIYPEIKHSTFFSTNVGNRTNADSFEDILVSALHANYGNTSAAPVYIQSFEVSNLVELNGKTDIKIAQLLNASGKPWDFTVASDPRTYADLAMPAGLDFINDYADGVGVNKNLMIPRVSNMLGTPTSLVDDAHAAGLEVHGWTFRAENSFLPTEFRVPGGDTTLGHLDGEILAFLQLGMDGFFTDHPDIGVAAVAQVPEPTTALPFVLGVGIVVLATWRTRSTFAKPQQSPNKGLPQADVRRYFALTILIAATSASLASAQNFQLTGWAEIPSTYRHPGPTSGQFTTGPVNGVTPPYVGQPIPGFSGMIPGLTAGVFTSLPDNGFGAQTNSADFVIGLYEVTPAIKKTGDGTTSRGPVTINSRLNFSDPNMLATADYITDGPVYARTNYYGGSAIAVDPAIKTGKLLTGADFDVESIARMNDGTFWVGEEFGPYLLHFNNLGELIDTPFRHPVLRAPQNPQNATLGAANLGASRGFESMSRNGDGTRLYLTTESSINSETDKRLLDIYEFDTTTEAYTGNVFKYAKDSSQPGNAVNTYLTGDMSHVADDRYIFIERDDTQGPSSVQKKLYLIDLSETDANGVLEKRLLVDLLNIPDPVDIGGPLAGVPANTFNFPLQSVESVTLIDDFTLLVGLDNNYPGGNGRFPGTPDGTEIITIRFDRPLASIQVPEPASAVLLLAGLVVFASGRRWR